MQVPYNFVPTNQYIVGEVPLHIINEEERSAKGATETQLNDLRPWAALDK